MASSIGRDDALLMFNTWAADNTLVRCELRFADFALSFDARFVVSINDELRLISDDARSELMLRLRSDFIFGYTDTREPPSEKYVRVVTVFYPYDEDPADANMIVFAEIAERETDGESTSLS